MESTHLLVFIYRNLKTLIAVGFLAAVAASGVSLMLDEYYESTVVMFATSQHSLGEQFFEETKKNDLLAFGDIAIYWTKLFGFFVLSPRFCG